MGASISKLVDPFLMKIGSTSKGINKGQLSQGAIDLINKSYEGVKEIYDMHSHLVAEGHGCCAHPNLSAPLTHPICTAKKVAFKSASGIEFDEKDTDQAYVDKLVKRTQDMGIKYKHFILAMDHWYDPDGTMREDRTGLYISNDYMMSVVAAYPEHFMPCISVNPYRADALAELDKYGQMGVKMVKWLPNSMGMDPSHPKCVPFYQKMAQYNMVLLCHVGEEHSVSAGGMKQSLGNPLLLRLALDNGVKVIAAHCASEGTNIDLDDPEQKKVDNFDLFIRLMDTPKYKGLLFADISSLITFKRCGKPLITILNRTDLHDRLVFGTDYPVPAIGLIVHTKALAQAGYITWEEKPLLDEIFEFNPLLFDFVLKRTAKSPDFGNKFSLDIFGWNANLLGTKS